MGVIIDNSRQDSLDQFLKLYIAQNDRNREEKSRMRLAELQNYARQHKALADDPVKQAAFRAQLPESVRELFVDLSLLPETESDRLRASILRANRDAVDAPIVTAPPTDSQGNVSWSAMMDRSGAGMDPAPVQPIETYDRLTRRYNLTTGDSPNEGISKQYAQFANLGEGGWRSANEVGGGLRVSANTAANVGERARQFDTRWPSDQEYIEAGTELRRTGAEENRQQGRSAGELATNRVQERTPGSPLNQARADLKAVPAGDSADPYLSDPLIRDYNNRLRELTRQHTNVATQLRRTGQSTDEGSGAEALAGLVDEMEQIKGRRTNRIMTIRQQRAATSGVPMPATVNRQVPPRSTAIRPPMQMNSPGGGGRPVDEKTAMQFLIQANGDRDLARELARQAGYSF